MNLFNKKKGNRGFTLVELLAAIVILGILSTMAIVSVSNLIKKAKSSAEDANAKTIQMAAESYIQANKDTAPKSIGECVTVSASDLKNKKFLTDEITNSNNESCMKNSYVKIFKSSNGKYIYTPYIYCGADKASTDSKDKMVPVGEIKFSKSTDVNKASFTLNLYGDQNKTKGQYTPTTEIDGYSWSLSVMYDGENSYTEVYNTGTLSANKAKFLEISEKLSDYVDISSVTKVKVDYMITNVVCETYTSEMVSDDGASSTTQFEDTVPPICGAVSGDASSEKDWVSNSSSSKTRLVSVACSDGDGSGCKRKSFSRSWPDKSAPYGVEKAYVDIYDNRDKKFDGNSETGNKTKCLVDVNVDLQTPSGSLIAAKTATGKNILSSKKALEIKASTDPIASNVVRVNDYSGTTSNWMNGIDFKDGVYFIVKVKDNLHLDHYTWETNKGDQTSVNESDVSVNYPDGVASTQIPQVAKYGKTALHGSTEYIITVRLNTEGNRYGILTVYDKAGNAIKYEMYANIDKTAPPVPEISLYKWKTNEEKNKPTNKTSGLDLYTEGSWTDKKIIAIPKSTDDKTSAADIIYKYTTTGKTKNEKDTIGNYRNIEEEGESTIKFKACDKAGNCSKYSDKKTVKLDFTPKIEIKKITPTTKSLNVIVQASSASGIAKYEYSKDNGKTWITRNDNTYKFDNLKHNTTYDIKVRVTSTINKTATAGARAQTNELKAPTLKLDESEKSIKNISGRDVSIDYNMDKCKSEYVCTYNKSGKGAVTVKKKSETVNCTDSGNLTATISDGYNKVSSTQNVKVIHYYVASWGKDEDGYGTKTKPYATIQRAYNMAISEKTYIHVLSDLNIYNRISFASNKNIKLYGDGGQYKLYRYISGIMLDEYSYDNLTINNLIFDGRNYEAEMPMISISESAKVEVSNVKLFSGRNVNNYGGGFFYNSDKNSTLTNVEIAYCNVVQGGAAIFSFAPGTLTLKNVNIHNNSSLDGTVWSWGRIIMESGDIHHNSATWDAGVRNFGYFKMTGGTIRNNSARYWSGGLLDGCHLCDGEQKRGTSDTSGGSIYNNSPENYKKVHDYCIG